MNRRSFIKKVSQALGGVFALALPNKSVGKIKSASTNIDPNSEWAKQNTKLRTICFSIGSVNGHSEYACYENGKIIERMSWLREMSPEEIAQLYREPFCIFKKPQEPILNENHPLADGLISYELFLT